MDVFFVISGFVVTRSILGQKFDGVVQFSAWFYSRRVRRILPVLLVSVLAVALFPLLFMPRGGEARRSITMGLTALFGLSNLHALQAASDYFGMDAEVNPYTHTWSLGVEEQFYLLFPFLLVLLCRPRKDKPIAARDCQRWRRWVLLALLVSSVVLAAFMQTIRGAAFYLMPTRFWELGVGVTLAIWEGSRPAVPSPPQSPAVANVLLSAAIVCSGARGFVLPFSERGFPMPGAAPSVVATGLAIYVGSKWPNSPLPRLFAAPIFVWIGKRSYSLYLWHWPVFVAYRWTVGLTNTWSSAMALLITVMLTIFSYRFIEQPGRRWKASSGRTLATGAMALGAAAVLMIGAKKYGVGKLYLGRHDMDQDWAWLDRPVRLGAGVWQPNLCALRHDNEVGKPLRESECTFSALNPKLRDTHNRRLVLLGNSFAEASLPMFRKLLEPDLGFEVTAIVAWGCPGTELRDKDAPNIEIAPGQPWAKSCRYFETEIVPRILDNTRPGDVVVLVDDTSDLTDHGPRADGDPAVSDEVNRGSLFRGKRTTPALRRNLMKEELVRVAQRLSSKRVDLVFQATTPLTRGINPGRCRAEWFRNEAVAKSLCPVRSRDYHLSERRPVMQMLEEVARRVPNFHIFDPFDQYCPGSSCEWFEQGRPIWRDDSHVAQWKAEQIGTALQHFLDAEHLL